MIVLQYGTHLDSISSYLLGPTVCTVPFFFYLIKPLELRRIEIVAISRPNWDKSFSLSDPNATGATTALALSVNGVYLASACKEGIFIWSTQTKHVLWR